MKFVTAQVIDGKIDVPSEITDGSQVAILAPEGQPVVLTSEQEQELAAALDDIQAGRSVDGWSFLEDLKTQSRV